MGNRINMLGQKKGRFAVLKPAGSTKHGASLWTCQCECGTIKNVRGADLRSGEVRSCGCLHPRLNLTGQQFGKLTVRHIHHHKGKRGQILWWCLCECGGSAVVTTDNLRSGNSRSCGCVRMYTGEKSARWDVSRSAEDRERGRNEKMAKAWRESVYLHNNYTCQGCGQRGGDLNAHHVIPYAEDKRLRYVPSNGITLCVKCHREFHNLHGNSYSKLTFPNRLMAASKSGLARYLPVGTIA